MATLEPSLACATIGRLSTEGIRNGLLSRESSSRLAALKSASSVIHLESNSANSLWHTACAAFESGPAWDEVQQGSRVVRAGPKLDALLLLVITYPHLPETVLSQPLLWRMLHYGIQVRDSNRHHRKAAIMVLKQSLQRRGLLEHPSPWPLFLLLLDALEDMPTHLILELWPRIAELTGPSASVGAISVVAEAEVAPAPVVGEPVPRQWLAALFNRAFTSEAAQSKRNVLLFSMGALDVMSGRGEAGHSEAQGGEDEEDEECKVAVATSEPVFGDYVATYVKQPWQSVGPDSDKDATPALLACMPPWYVAGTTQFLGCLVDSALFAGTVAIFGRALGRFLVGYGKLLLQEDYVRAHPDQPLYRFFVRGLVSSLPMFAQLKGALRSLLRALCAMPVPESDYAWSFLDDRSLASLRSACLSQSQVNGRTASEAMLRLVSRILVRFGTCDSRSATLPSVALMLSILPSAVALDALIGGTSTPEGSPTWAPSCVQSELVTWAQAGLKYGLEEGLAEAVLDFISGKSCAGVPWTSTSVARVLSLASSSLDRSSVMRILSPLSDSLATVHSHSYMDAGTRARAVMLLRALLCSALPAGGNADLHLSRFASGSCVPVGWTELCDPLYTEWTAANRLSYVLFPESLFGNDLYDALASMSDTAGVMASDDVEAALSSLHAIAGSDANRDAGHGSLATMRNALRGMLTNEQVNSEVSSFIEVQISSGLSVQNGVDVWAPDIDMLSCTVGRHVTPQSSSALTTTFQLGLLRDCLRACPANGVFLSSTSRLVCRAVAIIVDFNETAVGVTDAIAYAHAVHVLAVELCMLLPFVRHLDMLQADGQTLLNGSVLIRLLRKLVCHQIRRPPGSTEPALPLCLGQGSVSTAVNSASLSWHSVRAIAERARWVAVSALLGHGSQHGWGEPASGPCSVAMLPVADADALAAAVLDAIHCAGETGTAVLFGLAAWVSPYCMSAHESRDDVCAALNTWVGSQRVPVTSVSLEELLHALGQQAWVNRPGRGDILAYTAAAVHPALFLRKHLHAPGGALMSHLTKAWMILSDDAHVPLCAQILAARLLSAYSILIGLGKSSTDPRAASAQAVLLEHVPLLLSLTMHREFVASWEDPQLVDSHSRAQMSAWLDKWSTGADSSYWGQGCPQLRQLIDPANLSPSTGPSAAALLPSRGAGSVTRIQALTWLDVCCTHASMGNEAAISTLQALAIHLARLNMQALWRRETSAGSPVHASKLRAWQALALVAGYWGRECHPEREKTTEAELLYNMAEDMWILADTAASDWESIDNSAISIINAMAGSEKAKIKEKETDSKAARKRGQAAATDAPMSPWVSDMSPVLGAIGLHPGVIALVILRVVFFTCLLEPQTPSLRHYMEACAVALSRRFPSFAVHVILVPLLLQYNPRSQGGFSVMLVAVDLVRHLAQVAARQRATDIGRHCAKLSRLLLSSIFPFLTSPLGLVRLLAQLALHDAVPLVFEESCATPEEQAGLEMWVLPTLRLVRGCSEVHALIEKQRVHLARIAPALACTLKALVTSPVTEHGELVPVDAFSSIRATFRSITIAMHVRDPVVRDECDCVPRQINQAIEAGLLPPEAIHDSRLREGYEMRSLALECDASRETAVGEAHDMGFDFQRKVMSASEAVGSGRGVGGEQRSFKEQAAALVEEAVRGQTEYDEDKALELAPHVRTGTSWGREHPLLTHRTGGRPCQPLIIVASLVEKAPNLGGLARTCEIFSAESLVVRDSRVKNDRDFKDTAVTAGEWMDIHTVPSDGASITAYLRSRQADGYTVIGLEQSARSIMLGSPAAIFPDKVVLILGAEKEGVPADLLALVDMVVEVPQTGLIRSLNVHVSAALLVWEYTRQRMVRAGVQ